MSNREEIQKEFDESYAEVFSDFSKLYTKVGTLRRFSSVEDHNHLQILERISDKVWEAVGWLRTIRDIEDRRIQLESAKITGILVKDEKSEVEKEEKA